MHCYYSSCNYNHNNVSHLYWIIKCYIIFITLATFTCTICLYYANRDVDMYK